MVVSKQIIRQFISGFSLIILFMSVQSTVVFEYIKKYPWLFIVFAVLIFVFDKQIADKIPLGG
ncbi:MAG: hypothetical protein U9O94_08450 [Nanoarchaeota archaeon]|nr:hypothetical protein [Nanoarchaeota archaeon]